MARHHDDDDLPYIVVERTSDGSGILPFLWGALIGAGVALLYAPRSGRETRAEISGRARRFKEGAEAKVRGVQESVNEVVDNVRNQVSGRVNTARDALDVGRTVARESRADMERRIREARAGFESGAAAARAEQPFDDDELDDDI